ncbi:hypothetical protein LMG28688_02168 [Paraburkholderia caffeinitolerans]|uniref:Uncharacterized protein n=1 Tax=Paraburkholderia caffeinitolerans TaxID=1723730 RepID=A0A6J5FW78_9BURK|nr:hypothetical protein [Paraburkholderia caffeinitolerans]CAB3785983.1 hypothetical protein LMG28688_02168 [Paraburkholderia caffeinitolerans]
MKRTYQYRGHTLHVSVETVCHTRKGVAALDHVALLLISSDETMPYASLRIDRVAGRPFASEAEALMGGYGVGRSIVDKLIDNGERVMATIAHSAI